MIIAECTVLQVTRFFLQKSYNIVVNKPNSKIYQGDIFLSDVLILAEIFEVFRSECISNFELEPAHFISLPSFAYQVCSLE